jgi:methionyl-tRNA formyltransferase
MRAVGADAIIVAAYGLILPQAGARPAALRLHQHSCVAAPTLAWCGSCPACAARWRHRNRRVHHADGRRARQWAGVLLSATQPIRSDDTAASLHDRLAEQGAELVVEALARLPLPAWPASGDPASATRPRSARRKRCSTGACRLPGSNGRFAPSTRIPVRPVASTATGSRSGGRKWSQATLCQDCCWADRSGIVVACGEQALTSDRGTEGWRQAPFGGAVPGRNGAAAGFPRQRLLRPCRARGLNHVSRET